jgi:capsular exopolysaccharide synthesis family protein
VLQPVIRRLSLGTTAAELAGRVTATNPLATVLIDVTVSDASPTRAAAIANAISSQFPALVNVLEDPRHQTSSPVKVSVTRAAVPPRAPVSPRRTLNLALGLLAGLGLGAGAAVLRDSLDRTVTGRSQASQLAGAPVLGTVANEPAVTQAPLITSDALTPRAEAFRQLRTNIRFLSVDQRVSSLVVTGSLEGEGKTTTAANIALALAQGGEHVILIDADLRRPTMADIFGLPAGIGLTSVLMGDVAVDGALQRWRDDLPLDVLPAGPLPPNPSELIGSARMAEVIRELTGRGATVVVDSPPLLPVTDATILARVTDGALLVTWAAHTRVDQFATAVEALRTAGAPILGVVLNRVPQRGRLSSYGAGGYHGTYQPYAPARLVTAGADAIATGATATGATVPGGIQRLRGVRARNVRPEERSRGDLDALLHPGPHATLLGGPATAPPTATSARAKHHRSRPDGAAPPGSPAPDGQDAATHPRHGPDQSGVWAQPRESRSFTTGRTSTTVQ